MRLRTAIFGVLLFLQSALVLTGGAVRLTGSGLGCPTWPECTARFLSTPVPVSSWRRQLHAWIEFGNRLTHLRTPLMLPSSQPVYVQYFRQQTIVDLRLAAATQVLGNL